MATNSSITRSLVRYIATSPSLRAPSSRAFATSSSRCSETTPSLSDLNSRGGQSFKDKQKSFRDSLKAVRERAESQSSVSPSSAAGSQVASGAPGTASNADDQALGSLTTSPSEDARTAATEQKEGEPTKMKGALSSLIYGTEAGRQMDQDLERSFSQVLARGKYVHSIVFHDVKPDKVDEYTQLVGSWYPKVAGDPKNKVNLVGSWRTEVGDCDTFVHIWEYQRYHGYHDSLNTIQHHPEFAEFDRKLKTLIKSKHTSLMQEFSFWPTTSPRKLGGLFELRAYTLHPGHLLEWETHWRKGLHARQEVMEGVGAWFVQIGDLNTVYHLWQFADLEHRKSAREQSWAHDGWSDTVHQTVPLIQTMTSRILVPMKWSPVA